MKARKWIPVFCCLLLFLMSACGKSGDIVQKRVGTKVPPAFLNEEKEEEKEIVDVKAKGYEYDKNALSYELVWSDEFEYEGLPDSEKWDYQVGGSGWGNNELQYYTNDSNAWVKDGKLTIELRKEEKEGKDYTSARMVTRGKADWLYGKIEVRAKLPSGLGTWPAIWMMPTDSVYGNWPCSGEIDIMEHVGYNQDAVFSTVHTSSYNHTKGTQKGKTVTVTGASEEFHTYRLEWLPDEMTMYVDDREIFSFRPTDYKEEPTWQEWPYDQKMYLIMNIAYGGNLGGQKGTDDDCLPQRMEVEYVRVYQSPELAGMQQGDKVLVKGKEYVKDDRMLAADGSIIRNQAGEEVLLQGVNLGGWLITESWMTPSGSRDEKSLRKNLTERFGEEKMRALVKVYQDAWITEADLDLIAETGYNCVRVPMYYGNFMDDDGHLIAGAWEKLDWVIDACEKRDLYVILDLHGAPGGQSDMDHCGDADGLHKLWKYESWQDHTVKLWESLAARYKDCSTVAAYDLLNEPDKVDKVSLWKLYRRLYAAIRANDPDHIISMEAAWDWGMLPDPAEEGFENVLYQLHFYAMAGDEASDWNAQNNMIEAKLKECARYRKEWNVPIYIGEFNVFAFEDLWTKFIEGFQEEHINWSNWTYKVSSNYGNWGLYNNSTAPAPNFATGSYEEIEQRLSAFTSDSFHRNDAFISVLEKVLKK